MMYEGQLKKTMFNGVGKKIRFPRSNLLNIPDPIFRKFEYASSEFVYLPSKQIRILSKPF